jgi:hypothetical protein
MKENGVFSASVVGQLCGKEFGRSGYSLAYQKAIELVEDEKKHLSSYALDHGISNEGEAFQILKSMMTEFDLVYQSDEYKAFNANCGASPDVLIYDGGVLSGVLDIKCPSEVEQFFATTKKYEWQVRMQMMTFDVEKGALFYYLTAKTDRDGNHVEYAIPVEDRVRLSSYERDKEAEELMIGRVNQAVYIRDSLAERMAFADVIGIKEAMGLYKDGRLTHVKNYPETREKKFLKLDYEKTDKAYVYLKK